MSSWMTKAEAAGYLGVSPTTVDRYRKQGDLASKTVRHRVYFDRRDVIRFADIEAAPDESKRDQ